MAEMALQVVVSPLLGVIFDKLTSPLLGEFGSLWGVQKDLEKLSETASTVRLVLQDAEMKKTHHATADWLRKLKEAAYEADDVIDECISQALFSPDSEVNIESCSNQVCDSFSNCFDFKRIKLRHKIANRIKVVKEKFDVIAEERKNFHFSETLEERGAVKELSQYPETGSTVLETYVLGRDVDIKRIVDILLSNASSKSNLLVYSIVGIGGLGKTTLAQCVFNDTSIEKSFQVRIWVCVSEDFSAKRLMKMIIESISGKLCKLENLGALQNRLKELLSGKKFLLVLDDVWNEDSGKWDELKFPLKCGATGSSVITTTRLPNVAQIMGAHLAYGLTPLPEEECWSLFKSRAFEGEIIENRELEMIGKEIAVNCRGLPLVAKALGGLLRFERDVNVWISIKTTKLWELHEDGGILPSLRLSYNHLPSDLKRCFAYCSVFPKDYAMEITDLIQLWMANDLVQSRRGMELEDVGRQIFNQLVLRAFFQDLKGMKTCKMHDLMHDLACSVAGKECVAFDGGGGEILGNITKNTRHLSITPTKNFQTIRNLHPCLRTFLILRCPYSRIGSFGGVIDNLNSLRALDLSCTSIKNLPVSIGKMKHLRYLNLSSTGLVSLPTSLCDLKLLQTLKLRWCGYLKMLPSHMHKLVNLRHLDLYGCGSLLETPLRIGDWVGLRTLGVFTVGPGSGQRIKELQGLSHLGGDLEIRGLEHVRDAAEAKEANLGAKRNLTALNLMWSKSQDNSEKVLEALQPHQDFCGSVWMTGYAGSVFPSWIHSLQKLYVISLSDCSNCEILPPLGHLPLLDSLFLEKMNSLKRINPEFYGTNSDRPFFPSLKFLNIGRMPNWEEWRVVDDIHVFPRLKCLVLEECPKLAELPFQTLYPIQTLILTECSKLMVSSLPRLCRLMLSGTSFHSFQSLEALENLEIYKGEFSSMPQQLENLTSIKSLDIRKCNALMSLPQSLQHLPFLETIRIRSCSNLKIVSGIFQHLLSLQSLTFKNLPKLTSLPDLHHLPRLHTLQIYKCKNLPALPQWLQNFTSLRTLEITECHPDLHVRCNKHEGEYWPYISHIPVLKVASSSDP